MPRRKPMSSYALPANDPELFKIFPEERQAIASLTATATSPAVAPIMPQNDAIFLQTSADAQLQKIHKLRREEPSALNPTAPPFTPLLSSNSTTDLCLVVTTAEVHPQRKKMLLDVCDENFEKMRVLTRLSFSSTEFKLDRVLV